MIFHQHGEKAEAICTVRRCLQKHLRQTMVCGYGFVSRIVSTHPMVYLHVEVYIQGQFGYGGYGVLLMGIVSIVPARTGFTVLTATSWAQVRTYMFTPRGKKSQPASLGFASLGCHWTVGQGAKFLRFGA